MVQSDTDQHLKEFKQFVDTLKKNPDLKVRLAFWNQKLADKRFEGDSVLRSKIEYNIAGVFYGLRERDSLKKHMELAWAFMDNQPGHLDDKVLLYAGLGNAANTEHKIHQANYYFNQAGQMLVADTSLGLSAKQKVTIFFSAAQSSEKLYQFNNAFSMNREALKLLPQLPDDYSAQYRASSQMSLCFFKSGGSKDSVYKYVSKMDKLHRLHPDETEVRFLYDRKALYFQQTNQTDSSIYYNKKRLLLDEKEEMERGKLATSVVSANLFGTYSDLAGAFLKDKQHDSAHFYLERCKDFIQKYPAAGDDQNFISYHQNLLGYYFLTKQYFKAEQQQSRLINLFKSVYETENARAVAEMASIYQLQAKDKSINTLNQTVGIAQGRLQSNRLWLVITTLVALLGLAIALLLYFIQRQRKLNSETEKAYLEQRLLRTQMEPHFIFNTLSALQSFVRFDEKEKTLKYLNQFGRLLRSSLELSRERLVPLSEEIAALENYLSLQQMRYDDAFQYEINEPVNDDTGVIMIPPMLMQPFVENAIIHGIDANSKEGNVSVHFKIDGQILFVSIKDNGKGFENEHQKYPQHKSLSTAISKERLEILAKESGLPAGININSKTGEGTTIELCIPFTIDQ
ncbi:sensor histidine kinase [Pedobacter nototheniae]|uniref:sensor histidine kinase n=1 Tax=Pedobacter nototheniae TaxID=2488994 RepID=UPI0029306BC3|nr:histidine kinase [Pedobacter nototheniae]